jgi:hypothetical protein
MLRLIAVAVAVLGVSGTAWAQPSNSPTVVPRRCRGVVAYFESSAFVTTRTERENGTLSPLASSLLGRLASGLELRRCRGETSELHLRLGLALTVAGPVLGGETPGWGGELEASYPVSRDLRLGARLGADRMDAGTLFTFGLRLRYRDIVYLGVDGFRGVDRVEPSPREHRTSAMIGVGFEGRGAIPLSVGVLLACAYAVVSSINLR